MHAVTEPILAECKARGGSDGFAIVTDEQRSNRPNAARRCAVALGSPLEGVATLERGPKRPRCAPLLPSGPPKAITGHAAPRGTVSLGVERDGAGGLAVGALDDLLDPRLRRVEPRLAMPPQRLAPFVETDRFLERHFAALELADDVFERAQGLLEAHLGDFGGLSIHALRFGRDAIGGQHSLRVVENRMRH